MTDIRSEAACVVSSLPLGDLKAKGVFLDRLKDNPEAPRYFLAYGDWGRVSQEEVFQSVDASGRRETEVYVDFPFCPTICNFCAFYPVRPKSSEEMSVYVKSLKSELSLLRRLYFDRGFAVETIELGGGTPTFLPFDLLNEAITAILNEFPIIPGGEHSFETTPECILGDEGFAKASFLRTEAGFDRISIGAQSFSDHVLNSSNRSHDSSQIYEAFELARRLNFKRINLDLLLGLSDQTIEDFIDSIEKCIKLDADIVEIYTLRYFDTKKPVPLAGRYSEEPSRFLSSEDQLIARVAADLMLRRAGYLSSNGRTYQKHDPAKAYYSDYYKGNFEGKNIIGVGRKSFSTLSPWQYANYGNLEKYQGALDGGRLPIAAGCKLDSGGLLAKRLTGALQMADILDYESLKSDFDPACHPAFDELLEMFVSCGLLIKSPVELPPEPGAGLRKTSLGFLFIEEMLKAIYDAAVTPFSVDSKFLGREQSTARRSSNRPSL